MFLLPFVLGLLCSQALGWSEPRIKVNGNVPGSDVVLNAGSKLVLVCEGDGPVEWTPRLVKHRQYTTSSGNTSTFSVKIAKAPFTGTYKCGYTNKNASNISSVHIFVKDPKTPFVTPSTSMRVVVKEGANILLPCLLTDPDTADVQLQMDNGTAAPSGMNVTFDPRKGMHLQNLLPGYTADYVCAGKIGGVEKVSAVFSINVIEKNHFPPYVFLGSNEYVRLVGETLEISCSTHNLNFNYNVTWRHSSGAKLPAAQERSNPKDNGLAIQSILTIRAVNLSDTGNFTCTGMNEAGVNSSTTHLLVVEKPYLRVYPRLSARLHHQGLTVSADEGQDVELGVLIEAYPPVLFHGWHTPAPANTSNPQSKFFSSNNRYEAVLFLKRLNSREGGLYTFFANSSRANASITFRLHLYQKPVITTLEKNTSSLTCTAFGYPAPRILWYKCQGTRPTCTDNSTAQEILQSVTAQAMQREEFGKVGVESVVSIEPSTQKITVECVALSRVGKASATFPIDQSEKLFTTMLAGSIGIVVFLLLLLLILLYMYKQKPKYEIRWKIIEATDGNSYTFIDPTQLPYNERWEFPRDKLKLGKILGSGAFGKVVEATAYGLGKEDNVTRVAVKMLKAMAHPDEKEALMSELKILSHLGQHENIVNLLGACTYGGPVLVITEYCCHGDLLNFLRSKAETFLNCIMTIPGITEEKSNYKNITTEKTFFRSDSGFSSNCSDNYLDMRPLQLRPSTSPRDSSCEDQHAGSWPLDMDDLMKFSYQVAQGLEFLAAKNCIHRDVAARNVLVSNGCVAKICDFGLARDIMNDSNYVVKGNARLPVKWMAPESIFECVYTVQSDVWSYGILLWEIFSLGKSPYPNIQVDSKFYKMIKCGYQMSRPDFAPPEIYTIMKTCWNLEPTERPTFSKISQLIRRLLGETKQEPEVLEEQQLKPCEPAKTNEESCDQEDEEQPLMNANNYQFC